MFGIILLLWYLLCMQKMKAKKKLLRKYIHTIVAEWRAVSCSGNSLRLIYVFKCDATACKMPKGSIYHLTNPKMFLFRTMIKTPPRWVHFWNSIGIWGQIFSAWLFDLTNAHISAPFSGVIYSTSKHCRSTYSNICGHKCPITTIFSRRKTNKRS